MRTTKPKHATSRASKVFDALASAQRISDQRIADRTNGALTRGTVQARRSGDTAISLDDIYVLAAALDVEPYVFLMEPQEAVRWMLDNRPGALDLRDDPSRCMDNYELVACAA